MSAKGMTTSDIAAHIQDICGVDVSDTTVSRIMDKILPVAKEWRQIIRVLPLTTAFANKAVTTAWGLLWGLLFFHEHITIGKIVGVALVISGVLLFSAADPEAVND